MIYDFATKIKVPNDSAFYPIPVKSCPKNNIFYSHLARMLQDLRVEERIPIRELCIDSNVSTRTYSRVTRKKPVKPECYIRLLAGMCRCVSPEDFQEYWNDFGKTLYKVFNDM